MPRASYRATCKPDGKRVNEDSKLKSLRLAQRTRVSVEGWARS